MSLASGKAVRRVIRGYSNQKGSKGGYGYKKKKGYVYTTPATTTTTTTTTTPLPPIGEVIIENDSQGLFPPESPPSDVFAGRIAEITPRPVRPVIKSQCLRTLN
jgi:hypothetical protein